MLKITCPIINDMDVEKAIKTIETCYFTTLVHGLTRPFYGPGGEYGNDCWSLDYTLIMEAVKWLIPERAADYVENLARMQGEDGRIKLYGSEFFGHIPSVKEPISSSPKRLRLLPKLVKMWGETELSREALSIAERDFSWWVKSRYDEKSGLFSAVFEETFIPNTESGSYEYAPVDTNIELLLACRALAEVIPEKADEYLTWGKKLTDAVNRLLWDEGEGCYLPYDLRRGERIKRRMASTFLGFYAADEEKKERLFALLTDPDAFGWGEKPLYSLSKKDPLFQTVEGRYVGNPSWSGSVWTYHNLPTVKALRYAGYEDAATELSLKTIELFKSNYAEFLDPFTGKGNGVKDYGWSAAEWLQLLIEDIFGASYTAKDGLTFTPHFPKAWEGEKLSIEGLRLPDGREV